MKRKMDMIGPMNRAEVIKFVADTEKTPREVVTRFQKLLGIKG